MAKPTAQQCHALTTHYINSYEARYNQKPVVNRNKARWGMESLLMDYSITECKGIIDYYLDSYEKPNIEWFLMNYDKVIEHKNDRAERDQIAAVRRKETEKRLEEWRNRWKTQT